MGHPNRGHELLTDALKAALPPLYSQEGKTPKATVVVKFFSPYLNKTWYIIEGEEHDGGDWLLFNLFVNDATGQQELGYCVLSELEGLTSMGGQLPLVERDCHFGEHTLGEFMS